MKTNNKYTNILIKGIGTYLPSAYITKEEIANLFKKKYNAEVNDSLTSLGREKIYKNYEDDTVITLAYKASLEALKSTGLEPDDIDAIVFATDTPEYLTPSNAMKLNNLLGTKNAHINYDINANCAGVGVAFDQIQRVMKTKKSTRRVLVIGGVNMTPHSSDNDLFYITMADGASATILEKVEEDIERGFIDSNYYTESDYHWTTVFPPCGLSNLLKEDIDSDEKLPKSKSNINDVLIRGTVNSVSGVLAENGLTSDDLDFLIPSQLSAYTLEGVSEQLKINDRYIFNSNEMGYTGSSCIIFALKEAFDKNLAKEGNTIVISSAGAGATFCGLLYKC